MAVYMLDERLWFPDPYGGEEDGLIAVGGDLSVERLVLAYANGIFPWYGFKESTCPYWFCPLERFVIFPDEIHISHSMRTMINNRRYSVTFDKAFERVIQGCAEVDGRYREDGAWLGPEIIEAYIRLHKADLAHSVEVWDSDPDNPDAEPELAGGLYGVLLRGAFFGESMFSRVSGASKLALIHLARLASLKNWAFIDCQFETPHLKSMGGRPIPYDRYLQLLTPLPETHPAG